MSTEVEALVSSFLDELCLSKGFESYVAQSEAAGQPQLAKMFRALAAGEAAREAMFRKFLPRHAQLTCDYYVCPNCGLVYDHELPDACVVDQTPGTDFIIIQ